MSLFSQRLWESGGQAVTPSVTLQSPPPTSPPFSHSFLCRKFEGEIVGKENWPAWWRGERRRRERREEKQQRRQQMGGIEEEDGTLPFACCWRPFCSVTPPPPEAGQNGLCNYVWHGGRRGRRLLTGRPITSSFTTNRPRSLARSPAGSAMRE